MIEISDEEWQDCVLALESLRQEVEAWPVTDPDPKAERCEHSRHRTLAHLRAAQQTWLEAALLFDVKDSPSIVRPHPWRLFRDSNFEVLSWNEHMTTYLQDRRAWQELLQKPNLDRNRGGKLSRKPHTIASLTRLLVNQERHHVKMTR